MNEETWSALISRRTLLLRGGAAAAAAAAGVTFPSRAAGRPRAAGIANVRVSHDRYGVHVEPSVAVNPRNRRHLLVACQASPTANPEFVATYVSFDGGASWRKGGLPQLPAGHRKEGDDVTVAFDAHGRGYVCASSGSHAAGSDVYVWRTDDGGRSFSAPVSLRTGRYHDHPWVASGQGQNPSEHNVYVAWAAGGPATALGFTRSTNGGKSFEPPRTILPESGIPSMESAAPELAAGPHGLVCAVCYRTIQQHRSGDFVGQAVAVCSTDGGRSFAAPVPLGSGVSKIQLPGEVRPNCSPTVAVSSDGYLYAAFVKHQPGTRHSDIVVIGSSDGGRTWPKAVTATPADGVIYFQPNLAVNSEGRVAVSAFALANGRVNHVLLVSRPEGLRFRPPLPVTTTAFNPHSPTDPGKHGAWWIGDYQGITAGTAGAFHLVWNGTRTGKLDLFAATVLTQ